MSNKCVFFYLTNQEIGVSSFQLEYHLTSQQKNSDVYSQKDIEIRARFRRRGPGRSTIPVGGGNSTEREREREVFCVGLCWIPLHIPDRGLSLSLQELSLPYSDKPENVRSICSQNRSTQIDCSPPTFCL